MAKHSVLTALSIFLLSLPVHAQPGDVFGSRPPPEIEPTRDRLPATGQTIGGPSGLQNVPVDQEIFVLGFDESLGIMRVDACITLLNYGNGAARLSLFGAFNSSSPVGAGFTQVLCMERLRSAKVACLGDAPCSFEWRIDRAPVEQ